MPKGNYAGLVHHANPLAGISLDVDGSDRARLRVERLIKILFAGPAAQRKFSPQSWRSTHGSEDHLQAVNFAVRVTGSTKITEAFLRWLELETSAMVDLNWPTIEAVAAALLQRETMKVKEIVDVINRPRPGGHLSVEPSVENRPRPGKVWV